MKKWGIAALVVTAVVGVSVGVVFANVSQSRRAEMPAGDSAQLLHRAELPRGGTSATAAALPSSGFTYFETHRFNLRPGKAAQSTGKCPSNWKAISGYFKSNTRGVVPIKDFVGASPRKWTVAIFNEGGSTSRVFIGTVCGRV
jgi:hypothetical protein